MKERSFWLKLSVATLASSSIISLITYLLADIPLSTQALAKQKSIVQQQQARIDQWWQQEVKEIGLDLSNPKLVAHSLAILQAKRHSRADIDSATSLALEATLSAHARNRNSASLLTKGGIVVFSTNHKKYAAYQPLKNTTTSLELAELPSKPLNFFTDSTTGLPSISVALPIYAGPDKKAGFLAIDLNLRKLNDNVTDPAKGSNETHRHDDAPINSYLVARTSLDQATYIAPPNQSPSDYEFMPLDSVGIRKALDGNSGQGFYLNSEGVPVIGVYKYLPNFRTALLVESRQKDIYASARHMALAVFATGVILSLISLSMGALVGKDKIEPSEPHET
jgi:hypothetical protein